MSISSPTGSSDMQGFADQGVGISQAGADTSNAASDAMMQQMQAVSMQQMKTQTETAIMNLIVNINNALAKVMKAMGSSIKELAGG